jgi:hypothetical protein
MEDKNVVAKIKEILMPKLGEFVTDSTIRVNCERLNIKPEELTVSQTPEFVEKIKVTLFLFFDEKETEEISQKILSLKMTN